MSKKISRIINTLDKILFYCIGVLNAILVVLVFIQVVARSLFISVAWTEEAAMFILCYLVFLGAAVGFKNNEHFRITAVAVKLPPKYSKYLSLFIQIIVMILLILMAWSGIVFFRAGMRAIFAVTHIAKSWLYIIYPVTITMTLFYAIVSLARTIKSGI